MTTQAPSTRSQPAVRQLVYVRRRAVTEALPINGETDYWVLDENLRCDQITTRDGVFGTAAQFTFVPSSATEMRIEYALKHYSTDDQVKVITWPVTDELIDPVVEPENAPVLFEGILGRMMANIVTSDQGASENIAFTAQPLCLLDNRLTEHLITGRWMFDRKTPTIANQNKPMIAYSPDLPAVFNFNGRPNRSRQRISSQIIAGTDTSAFVFTHDDDPAGKHWTVRTALASLIVMHLYGPSKRITIDGTKTTMGDSPALNRNTCIEPLLRVELDREATAVGLNPQHRNLGMILPECNVHGLPVLSAIEKVCQVAGLKMALECITTATLAEATDRRYQLRIWMPGFGTKKEFRLAKPNTSYSRAEDLFKNNNIHGLSMMVDGDNVINEVFAAGTASFEEAIVLKPGWSPDDVSDAEVDRQIAHTDNRKLGVTDSYHSKHVKDGAQFAQYGHVGRLWIADCVGDPFLESNTNFKGYTSGDYLHPTEGFDFVAEMALDVTGNPVEQERATLGLYDPAIRWSNRLRRALPLRNPTSQTIGENYIVEVSEDGGSTWKRMDSRVAILREAFGIKLSVDNLATKNYATLFNDSRCQAKDSWWALIKSEMLSFRITCSIKSDSGAVAFAERNSTSGSVYKRGRYIAPRGIDEVWQAPGSPVNATSGVFRRVIGWGGYGATTPTGGFDLQQYSTALREAAALQQSATENVRRAMKASLYLFSFGEYGLGDVITKIKGRDISLGTNQGEAEAFPNIVGITYVLAPAKQQGITISLEDHALDGRISKGGR